MSENNNPKLGHEVEDIDRNSTPFLASVDGEGNAASADVKADAKDSSESSAAAGSAAAAAAGAAAAGTAASANAEAGAGDETSSDYEPKTSVVGEASEEHVGAAPTQPDLQGDLDAESGGNYEPKNAVVGEASEEHVGTAPTQPDLEADLDAQTADETASDYEPKTSMVGEASEEHIAEAPEQPDLQVEAEGEVPESTDDINLDPELSSDNAEVKDDSNDTNDTVEQLKEKAAEAGGAVSDAFNRAKDFVGEKIEDAQSDDSSKGGFFDKVKGAVKDARETIEERTKKND
ncbi:MAG: kinesin [Corynebacterium camporealensis]|uniref:kinesin n=1 Tax=Corynebacterium camporealensis TaxID=161896 RepID=UPI002A90C94F|nr:kinesin [Corynebacterium camporealensis]MDY5840988.1 kinesin [Corynebacterium camporealensis]